MSNLDKNILITPNVGSNNDPTIVFSAANTTSNAANITMRAYPTSNGTLSFEGSAGQLFSITNQLTGTLFSVNDISGIPSIEVLDTGRINLAQYNGNVVIGASTSANASTSNTTGELVVFGGVGVTGNIYVGGTSAGSNGIYTDVLRYAANGLPWVISGGTPTTAFSRVVISGQPDAIANIANSPLTLVAGSGIALTTSGTANSITISTTGGGGGGNVSASGYTANTILTADSGGFLGSSNSFFVASNNAIVTRNVSITQAATASFPLSFGQGLGNKIGLYDSGSGAGYGFGIQAAQLQIFSQSAGSCTSIGHGNSSSFTEQFRVNTVASAVNYLQVSGNTAGNPVAISAQGTDTNLDINITTKGTGKINFFNGNSGSVATPFKLVFPTDYSSSFKAGANKIDLYNAIYGFAVSGGTLEIYGGNGSGDKTSFFNANQEQFRVVGAASAVNYLQVTGSIANSSPILSAQGSSANVAINLVPKGNGAVMITGNTTSTINVANSLYVGGVVGFANANNISVVYQSYNASTNSLDVVFG